MQHSFLQEMQLLLQSGLKLSEFLLVMVNGLKTLSLKIGLRGFRPDFPIRPHPAIQASAHARLLGENGYAKKKQNERERASRHVHLRLAFWGGRESTTVLKKRRKNILARRSRRDRNRAPVMLSVMPAGPSVAIVGPGNLGSALALALARAGFAIDTIFVHGSGPSLKRARALAKRVKSRAALGCKNLRAEVVWFCVPDSEIRGAARLFSRSGSWKGRVAFHSSGALNSDALESLRQKGAKVASVHPLMTFVERSAPALGGVPFAIEGDRAAVRVAGYIVKELGGYAYAVRKQDKAAYHAWATFTSPLLTALLATTEEVAKLAGLRGEDARGRMMPILRQTLANYAEFGAARGFSGPIIRGDVQTVKEHLEVLRKAPEARAVYVALARAATTCLPAKQKKALRRLLARPE